MESLLAIGPLPGSADTNAISLRNLIEDLQSEVLWESGIYEVADWAGIEASTDRISR